MHTLYRSREDIAVILPFVNELEVGVVVWMKFIGLRYKFDICFRHIKSMVSCYFT